MPRARRARGLSPEGLMPDANDIVTAFLAAYNRHDWQGAAALYAPEATHHEAAMGKTRTGRAAIEAGLNGLAAMLPDVAWHERERITSGPHLLLRYDLAGTFTPRAAADATPRTVSLPGILMFTLTGGRIAATADYWDKEAFLARIR
ncbi:nuclear transport factor 2 family protein [Sinirhodobacter populi]|uniref:Nuclear transport factor 2 family protein n=2 Tax=Paenirhodobacter populi TaxID=2306993 RepID=A0A443KM50_9RHOB|nr:nuclear transport factor 2 family protein [Sinirhodobacter populi]